MSESNQPTPAPGPDSEAPPLVSFKLLVTFAVGGIFLLAMYMLYAGATGVGTFKKTCEQAKGKAGAAVIGELTAIGATAGNPSENGSVVVVHQDGAKCVLRINDDHIFSAIFEE